MSVSRRAWPRMKRPPAASSRGSAGSSRSCWENDRERWPTFLSPNGGSARMRSNSRPAAASWCSAANASCVRNSKRSGGSPAASRFSRIMAACRVDFSTLMTLAAPRLRHSKPSAPEPANNSRIRAPATRSPRLLKTACLTKSGVGRTANPLGTFNCRRPKLPPVMRMAACNAGLPQNESRFSLNSEADGVDLAGSRGRESALTGPKAAPTDVGGYGVFRLKRAQPLPSVLRR